MSLINQSVLYSLIPAATVFIGGLTATIKTPAKSVSSFTQHFASGVVFAAVALELLPKLSETKELWPLTLGFVLGVGLMLLIKQLTGGHSHDNEKSQGIPWNLLIAVAIDLFIDGLLIGIAFVAGEKGGILVTIALGIEILFLSLSLIASTKQRQIRFSHNFIILIIMAFLIVLGSFVGSAVISHAGPLMLEAILAFGVAALLYLVTEELLEEAHEIADTPIITSAFFAGFLIIYIINQQM
jgi:zinc transporter, ZIP family